MTHTGRMSIPIRPGTARRLGLRRPGEWSDTMERCTRPGWGSTDGPGWSVTGGVSFAEWAARAKHEHEFKPLGEYVAAKLADVYDLPAGMRLEWTAVGPSPKPLVNPLDAAALRQLGLADDQFDVSPPAETP